MKTHFKFNLLLAGVIAAMVSLTSCTKDELTPTNAGGGSGDPNNGVENGTFYEPGLGSIVQQRQSLPLPGKEPHRKHKKGPVSVTPQSFAD
jgi:hypothetical protein